MALIIVLLFSLLDLFVVAVAVAAIIDAISKNIILRRTLRVLFVPIACIGYGILIYYVVLYTSGLLPSLLTLLCPIGLGVIGAIINYIINGSDISK